MQKMNNTVFLILWGLAEIMAQKSAKASKSCQYYLWQALVIIKVYIGHRDIIIESNNSDDNKDNISDSNNKSNMKVT